METQLTRYSVDDMMDIETKLISENRILLQQFLTCMGYSSQIGGEDMDTPHIILDTMLDDGYRYVLTRVPNRTVSLSRREWEIVRLIAQGLPNKGIAQVLEISQFTVATHLRRIFAKLEVNSRAEMVAKALELNLLQKKGSI
jgi:ATP/maltotriose-dependent transcriptional regulator MalT